MNNKTPINVVNTNARSLRLKITSLITCFTSLALTFAIISETWFGTGTSLELESEKLLLGFGLDMICLNRPPINDLSHGGVAVVYRASESKASTIVFPNPDMYEILPVQLCHKNIRRRFFLVAVYIPPNYTVPRASSCLQHLNDLILYIKNKHSDPYIVIAGDFNQWPVSDKLEEFPDICEVPSAPTRGD